MPGNSLIELPMPISHVGLEQCATVTIEVARDHIRFQFHGIFMDKWEWKFPSRYRLQPKVINNRICITITELSPFKQNPFACRLCTSGCYGLHTWYCS